MSRYTKHAPEDFPYEEYLPVANVDEYDAIGRLGKLEDIFYAPDGSELVTLDRLRELVEADRDGRCVVLPCKVGDVVYSTSPNQDKVIACYVPSLHTIARWIEDGVFGKTVFLTRAEAEAALVKEGEAP